MDVLFDSRDLILASIALLVSGITLLLMTRKFRVVEANFNAKEQEKEAIETLKATSKQHTELLNELKMVTQGMSQKLTLLESKEPVDMATKSELASLKEQLQSFEAKLQGLENQDPTSRLYTKASKLVAAGASVEEIMQECDLPRAEAELVMSLHAKK